MAESREPLHLRGSMSDEVEPTTPGPEEQRRTGIVIGILVSVLLVLLVYLFWRGTGVRDRRGHHPPKPAAMETTRSRPR